MSLWLEHGGGEGGEGGVGVVGCYTLSQSVGLFCRGVHCSVVECHTGQYIIWGTN